MDQDIRINFRDSILRRTQTSGRRESGDLYIQERSNLHEPKVKIDPAAAAKGAAELMASCHAPPERRPLANVTNLPRPTVSERSKAVHVPDSAPTATADMDRATSRETDAVRLKVLSLRPKQAGLVSLSL